MAQTFEQMCAERDPLYAETRSHTPFLQALTADREAEECRRIGGLSGVATIKKHQRDVWLCQAGNQGAET